MMDIDKIRQKILDLAIRGKLVPQDPNDEPASILVEKIKAEKEKMVKEGKIKPSKDESYIYKDSDNCYYENQLKNIPDNWMLCKFGSIVTIKRGASPRPIKSHLTNSEDGINWIKIGDTLPGEIYINSTAEKIKKESVNKSVFLKKGALILSNSMSFGRPYILNIDGCIHDGWLAIELYDNSINKEFLQRILQGYMWYFKSKASGSGVDNLNIDKVKEMPFALPPINEQKRILDQLREIDEILKKIDSAYDEIQIYASTIKHKILDLYFGENSSYKSYYAKEFKFGEILKYEQPTKYIVKTTNYSDKYATPVLTAGKSYILGYTNETDGIYHIKNGEKVIIFDDFTTSSQLVNFDFKVKSSAMKILTISDADIFNIEYIYYLLQTLKIDTSNHKRYWISQYANKIVRIHTRNEQDEIVRNIHLVYELLSSLNFD